MALLSFKEFSHHSFSLSERFLGCDVGEKTIGLALSDITKTIATPLTVIKRTKWKKDALLLKEKLSQHQVAGLIVGFPLNMNGTEGPRCQSTRQFSANMLDLSVLPLCLWDERLSTQAITRTLLEADLSRGKRKPLLDKMAAAYILQGFLDAFQKYMREMK